MLTKFGEEADGMPLRICEPSIMERGLNETAFRNQIECDSNFVPERSAQSLALRENREVGCILNGSESVSRILLRSCGKTRNMERGIVERRKPLRSGAPNHGGDKER